MHSLTLVLAAAAIGLGFAASEHIGLHQAASHAHMRSHVHASKDAGVDLP